MPGFDLASWNQRFEQTNRRIDAARADLKEHGYGAGAGTPGASSGWGRVRIAILSLLSNAPAPCMVRAITR